MKLILSCEHGGNRVPGAYRYLFEGRKDTLKSHRGWDTGALDMAKTLADQLHLPLYFSTISRLLVELNRSLHHPSLFSEFTNSLHKEDKQQILRSYYFPYRNKLKNRIQEMISRGDEVIHLSVHSFTPVFNKTERNCDIGLLYDPRRKEEKQFCLQWKTALKEVAPTLRVRFNYPYLGKSDGFTSYLRKQFSENYAGIELEASQALFKKGLKTAVSSNIATSLKSMKITC